MKKIVSIVLICALLAACPALAAEDPAKDFVGEWNDPYYGRAVFDILPGEPDDDGFEYDITITWGNSADSSGVWEMEARWVPATGRLEYDDGELDMVTYGADGRVVKKEEMWDDAVGAFWFDEEGVLRWTDSREERSTEFALTKMVFEGPAPESFASECFERVAAVEWGTAGSSLKQAICALDLVRFAANSSLWCVDAAEMEKNMQAAWDSLDEDTQTQFRENFYDFICGLIESAFEDYDDVEGQFEDAGVGADMDYLTDSETAEAGWKALRAAVEKIAPPVGE